MKPNSEYQRAIRLHNLATRFHAAGDGNRPEKLYLRSLAVKETVLGASHPEVAVTLSNLGLLYKSNGNLVAARRAYERAQGIVRSTLGASHPIMAKLLRNFAELLKAEAKSAAERARETRQAAREMANPRTIAQAKIRSDLARYKLAVRPSRIHRFGVFAVEPIPAGERIIDYAGQRVSRRESVRRSRKRTYLFKLTSYWSLDGSVGGSGAELINHCCEPNCRFRREDGKIWIESLRPIETGEELLFDYKFRKDGPLEPCFCGAPNCRGTINVQ